MKNTNEELTLASNTIRCLCADMIEKAFVTDKWAEFESPGHEEIELALIKLYRHTKKQKYLKICIFT